MCQCLVPALRLGDIVISDNKRHEVRELIEAAGAQLRKSLPPCRKILIRED